MRERLFEGKAGIRAQAWFLGTRLDVRAFEQWEPVALAPLTVRAGEQGCAVLFRFGAVVLFELSQAEERAFLDALAPYVRGCFDAPESETADIRIAADERERVDPDGTIVIRHAGADRMQILAEALAKSAVLSHYEERVAAVFDRIELLAETLQKGTRRVVRDRELLQQVGEVLLTQTRTVGRVEVSEKPEITWDEPELDRLYERLAVEFELRERERALGRKLEVVSRTVETYLELLQNRRSLRVEWYIVILILFEIVLTLYEMFF